MPRGEPASLESRDVLRTDLSLLSPNPHLLIHLSPPLPSAKLYEYSGNQPGTETRIRRRRLFFPSDHEIWKYYKMKEIGSIVLNCSQESNIVGFLTVEDAKRRRRKSMSQTDIEMFGNTFFLFFFFFDKYSRIFCCNKQYFLFV